MEQKRRIVQLESDLEETLVALEACDVQIQELIREREQRLNYQPSQDDSLQSLSQQPSQPQEDCSQCPVFERQLRGAESLHQREREEKEHLLEQYELEKTNNQALKRELDQVNTELTAAMDEANALRRQVQTLEEQYQRDLRSERKVLQELHQEQCASLEQQVQTLQLELEQYQREARRQQVAQKERMEHLTQQQEQALLKQQQEYENQQRTKLEQQQQALQKEWKAEKDEMIRKWKAEKDEMTKNIQNNNNYINNNTPKTTFAPSSAPPKNNSTTTFTPNPETHRLVLEQEWQGTEDLVGIYTGWFSKSSNTPDGDGTLRFDDGAVYDGAWHHGLRQGSGVYATVEGDVYRGEWYQDVQHGQGTYVWSDGRLYRGHYECGLRQGPGVLCWPYGAHYQGDFDQDKRNGQGIYTYADGRSYTGAYQDDRPHGFGTLRAADGAILYEGQWEFGEQMS
ncbi:hypothetical protein ACA910_014210 [Epithemia clementina (nom. ined.)]